MLKSFRGFITLDAARRGLQEPVEERILYRDPFLSGVAAEVVLLPRNITSYPVGTLVSTYQPGKYRVLTPPFIQPRSGKWCQQIQREDVDNLYDHPSESYFIGHLRPYEPPTKTVTLEFSGTPEDIDAMVDEFNRAESSSTLTVRTVDA
jgi:hypothetical protein